VSTHRGTKIVDALRNPAPGVYLKSSGFKETPAPPDVGVFGVMAHQRQMLAEQHAQAVVDEILKLIFAVTDEKATVRTCRDSEERLVQLIAPLIAGRS
jgi:hypothetical protein